MNIPLVGSDDWLNQRILVAFVKGRAELDSVLSRSPGIQAPDTYDPPIFILTSFPPSLIR